MPQDTLERERNRLKRSLPLAGGLLDFPTVLLMHDVHRSHFLELLLTLLLEDGCSSLTFDASP